MLGWLKPPRKTRPCEHHAAWSREAHSRHRPISSFCCLGVWFLPTSFQLSYGCSSETALHAQSSSWCRRQHLHPSFLASLLGIEVVSTTALQSWDSSFSVLPSFAWIFDSSNYPTACQSSTASRKGSATKEIEQTKTKNILHKYPIKKLMTQRKLPNLTTTDASTKPTDQ